MTGSRAAVGLLAAALLGTGCGGVNRRFVVESNVPNAQVTIDQRRVGAAPAHAPFDYYGVYTITVSHPDYQTHTQRVHVPAPWYAYPPFDFLAEVLWPFRVEDVRRYYFPLDPARRTDVAELLTAADALRDRGLNLPPPEHPAAEPPPTPPPPVTTPVPAPAPAPPPGPAPLPPPSPLTPDVGPRR